MARKNGAAIIADPAVGLEALTHTQATFTHRDLAMFAHRHSDGKEQFDRALAAIRHLESLLALGRVGRGAERFTTRCILSAVESFFLSAVLFAISRHHSFSILFLVRSFSSSFSLSLLLFFCSYLLTSDLL